jgi:hypothetical protein
MATTGIQEQLAFEVRLIDREIEGCEGVIKDMKRYIREYKRKRKALLASGKPEGPRNSPLTRIKNAVASVKLVFQKKGMNDTGYNLALKEVRRYYHDPETAKRIVDYIMPISDQTDDEIIAKLLDSDLQLTSS